MRFSAADRTWVLLIALTALGVWLKAGLDAGALLGFAVAGVIALKGRLVIDHYLELPHAHPWLRRVMRAYFWLLPALVVASTLGGETIRRLTQWFVNWA